MTLDEALVQLKKGREYEITYCIPGVQRYDCKSRMSYLGSDYGARLQFNARPAAGTQTYEARWIKKIADVGQSLGRDDPKRYVGRRA